MDINSITGTASSSPGTTQSDLSGISGDDFMQILIKELQFQDPFEPMSNQEMIAQMSSIRELELNTRLSDSLAQVSEQQRFGAAAALIGKYAQGAVSDAEGNVFPVEGVVTGIRFSEKGDALLELDTGDVLPLTGLQRVSSIDEV